MNTQDLLNISSITISTILSVGAIILSIWFYKESNKQNKETALLQTEIKNAIEKLEQLYNRTYTDTFGALKTQLDAMQKHIFSGENQSGSFNNEQPNMIRFSIIGCIQEKGRLTVDELCTELKQGKDKVMNIIYKIHEDGIVMFDGKNIEYKKTITSSSEGVD